MFIFLSIVIVLVSLLLIPVTFIQNSKKEGQGNMLGNMGANQLIGVKRTTDTLNNITWFLIITLGILCFISYGLLKPDTNSSPNLQHIDREKNISTNETEENKKETDEDTSQDSNNDNKNVDVVNEDSSAEMNRDK
jgi:preprotein translocase subunit SecG